MTGNKTRVAIGVITRKRPTSFGQLLGSFVGLSIPAEVEPVYLVVENEEKPTLGEAVGSFRGQIGGAEVHYEHEPKLGIPRARNRVLDLACGQGCDLLAFIDDDERADEHWLIELYGELKRRGLDLVGGPVRTGSCPEEASAVERAIWRGVVHRGERIEAAAGRRHRRGTDDRVTIVTSNWLVALDFVRRHGLRFDEGLGFSGGSDTLFYRQARAAGARTGWAPKALVHEYLPRERLRPGYQYRRGRDQAISSFRTRHSSLTPWTVIKSAGFIPFKTIHSTILMTLSVLDGGRSSARALRALGFAVGRAQALAGRRSRHYANVLGG